MTTSSLHLTHTIICKGPSVEQGVSNTGSTTKTRDVFSNASQRGAHICEYPFEHGEVINYTLDGVSIHPVTTKIRASFLTQVPEGKETVQGFHHEANGNFKTVTEFNDCDWRKLRMDQHCSYST